MIKELSVVRYIEESEFTDKDIVDISHTYSKDIEHLEENIETLEELFKDMDIFQLDEIITTLMN